MSNRPSRKINDLVLDHDFVLSRGDHKDVAAGACLLEAVSYVAGERWSDHPACVCPVLAAYGRAVNDRMSDEDRQRLVPLIPRLVGTRGSPELALRRMRLLVDRSVRQIVPLVLRDLASARAAEPLGSAARAASYDYATAYVADSAAAATTYADAAASADSASASASAAAAAATYAAYAANAASAASYSSEHAALVLAAFVEAIDLARTVES